MKTFTKSISLAALLFLGGQAFAADHAAILGTWVSEMSAQGQSISIQLVIRNGSNGLEGTMKGPRAENSLEEFKFDGKEVSFKSPRNGSTATLAFVDNELRGELSTQQGPFPLEFRKLE